MKSGELLHYYQTAFQKLGPQHWWPGETPFEICVGAILTQNTNWKNVEKAIQNLKNQNVLAPHSLYALTHPELAEMIRPAGYFNIKAKRLKNFIRFLVEEYEGDLNRMFQERLEMLREKILSISGIGPETADSILLYAGQKPVFVVDAYTKRIFSRHQMVSEEADYHELQRFFSDHLPEDSQLFNEYHALIVNIGKNWCKSREPACVQCPWKIFLPS